MARTTAEIVAEPLIPLCPVCPRHAARAGARRPGRDPSAILRRLPYIARMTSLSSLAASAGPGVVAFRKMHGLGNDFVLLDLRHPGSALPEASWVRALADRNTGIGFDQLIGILPGGNGAEAELVFWNADGSEAGACGNGTRCAADILMQEQDTGSIALRTHAGILRVERHTARGDAGEIAVDFGPPRLDWQEIPLAEPRDTRAFETPGGAAGLAAQASAVNMGNPHCILFLENVERAPVAEVGPVVGTDPLFPEGTNVSFAELRAPDRIRLRVWERGVGETRACGSAACATHVAAVRLGLAGRSVRIELNGGTLHIDWAGDTLGVRMRGPVASVFEGMLDPGFTEAVMAGRDEP